MKITHKTGFQLTYGGGSKGYGDLEVFHAPSESWHRTLTGAWKAREKNGGRGDIYRILSVDHAEKVHE